MNYYDELLDQIQQLMMKEEYEDAKRLILNELDLPYVPRDIEKKLHELLDAVSSFLDYPRELNEFQIREYLFKDEEHQLLAVNQLDRYNLRDHLELIEKYLLSDGSLSGKALLIDSLIRQQVDHVFFYHSQSRDLTFCPKNMTEITVNSCFQYCLMALREDLMKEPSKLKIAEQLLYKQFMFHLPESYELSEGSFIVSKIEDYIEEAFLGGGSAKSLTE